MAPRVYFLGVDQGTQSTKTVLYDRKGNEIKSSSVPVALRYSSSGQITQDPDEVFHSIIKTISTTVHESGVSPGEVVAIAIDSQICSMVAVDEELNPVIDIISHLDTSSNKIRDQLLAIKGNRILTQNGSMPYIASQLLWLQITQPEKYQKIFRVMLVGAYCSGKLCGFTGEDAFVDQTTMNVFGWGDLDTKSWDQDLAKALNIDWHLNPAIRDSMDVIGGVHEAIAAKCGLKSGTPVIAGTGDAIAGWIGLGADQTGMMVDTSGTANHLCICVSTFIPDLTDRILSYYPSVSESLGYQIGFTAGTGKTHRWVVDLLQAKHPFQEHGPAVNNNFQEFDTAAREIPPGSDGAFFIPHFGGRVCPPQPEIRGGWMGLEWHHTQAHLYRSVLESIAYEYALFIKRSKAL
ncbi:MAG: FGGY family carbohydrate kinase, partial [Bacteroidales bacterium]|nr:FGGY family carbohydrate kinase [Bacteroidales bacterium]